MSDDAELLEAWRSGDRASGERLIERHYESVLRFFRTKSGEDADDLVQRTFLRCAEPKNRYRGDSSFRAFLFGIARNVLYEYIRSRVRDRKVDPDFGVSSVLDLNPRASTIAFRKAEQQLLVQALQRVPIEIQMAIELYYWEELSIDELAQALAVPPGTIKSRLHRGRQLLREAMENMPPESAPHSARTLLAQWIADMRDHLPGDSDPPDPPG